jgi:hypothetical protein
MVSDFIAIGGDDGDLPDEICSQLPELDEGDMDYNFESKIDDDCELVKEFRH